MTENISDYQFFDRVKADPALKINSLDRVNIKNATQCSMTENITDFQFFDKVKANPALKINSLDRVNIKMQRNEQ